MDSATVFGTEHRGLLISGGSQRKDCSFSPVGFCMHSKIYFSPSLKLFFDFCI